ncbi:MAG: hypothetical protein R3B13_35630 [Polyangiaceae bacterium]
MTQSFRRALAGVLFATFGAVACEDATSRDAIVIKSTGLFDEPVRLVPRTALAEYVEVPSHKNELIISLASDDVPCGRFVAADADSTRVIVSIVTPPGPTPAVGRYEATSLGESAPRGIVTTLRHGPKSRVLPPGGYVELRRVDLSRGGRVEGILELEFAGTAEVPPASVRGRFEARLCRLGRRSAP